VNAESGRGRSDWKRSAAAGLIGLLVGGAAVAIVGGGARPGSRAEVETVVREYILAHPQIIPQAMERLQERELGNAVRANRAAFETPFASAWAGAEKGDIVLVEFFDYACGFCRASNADIDRLLREDKGLKVVWRELPVLGPDSQAAAEASLAAARQGRFRQFYQRMFEQGRPSPTAIEEVRQATGVAAQPATPEVRAEIDKNIELARAIRASGTPTFVVGDKVLQGAVGYDALKEAIAEARAAG
jgi:DSBA-like thioredoxin domain/Copper resistance protein ScsC N-terminal domain